MEREPNSTLGRGMSGEGAPLRLGCVFESTIGHATFRKNLAAQMERWPDVAPRWHDISYQSEARWPPKQLNWTLRSGLMARRALSGAAYDGLLFHTQVPALLCLDHLRRAPALLSMDATPAQNAQLGIYGGGSQRFAPARFAAARWVSQCVRRSYRVVAWSEWVRDSLVREYGVDPGKVAVIPPGIDVGSWEASRAGAPAARPSGDLPRILFVGGDLRAKGGMLLLNAFRRHWRRRAELHLVTRDSLPPEPGVVPHRGLTPNSPDLVRLYHQADLFVLPTLGDTFAQAIVEAMACGIPVVASNVGAISEVVAEGETGILVPKGSTRGLSEAVDALLDDPAKRHAMGEAGRARARARFDIARNGRRIVDLLHQARAERPRLTGTGPKV